MKRYATSSISRIAGDCCFRMNSYSAGINLPEHSHADPYLCFVVRGSYREWSGGRLTLHSTGTAHHHAAGDRQHVLMGGDGAICISVSPLSGAPGPFAPSTDAGPLGDLREELIHAFRDSSADSQSRLAEVASALLRRVWGADPLPPAWLQLVESQLRDNEPPRISDLADEVGVHPVHLWKSFRRWYGQTPGEYSRRVRIDRAKAMLAESPMPLSQIAAELGFSDESHFIRIFKACERTTPARYRQELEG